MLASLQESRLTVRIRDASSGTCRLCKHRQHDCVVLTNDAGADVAGPGLLHFAQLARLRQVLHDRRVAGEEVEDLLQAEVLVGGAADVDD